jgi:glc operon protein GlcG
MQSRILAMCAVFIVSSGTMPATDASAQQPSDSSANGVSKASSQAVSALPLKRQLTLAAAQSVVQAAERYAAEKGWPAAISVVDDGGWPLLTERMDGAPVTVGPQLAQGKARTAALFKRSSGDLENAINKGRQAAITAGFTMMQGGRPLVVQGQVVGAVGISADTPLHDDEIAQAALRAFE